MSVQRYDLNKCIGCGNCVNVCPMDVFRFNEDVNKSVIAYPENCQVCGQCYVYCLGHSLAISGEGFGYPITSIRAATNLPMNRHLYVSDVPRNRAIVPAVSAILGAMFAHNAIVWSGKNRERRQEQHEAPADNQTVVRMNTHQRGQHLAMLVSFILLVISGFTMRYAGVWLLHTLGTGTRAFGILHRAAGVVLIATGLYHLGYLLATGDGRRLLCDLLPRFQDVRNVWGTMCYYLGLSQEKPKAGRFTYAEKAEYWALAVGTVSMGLTGTLLWAYVRSGHLLGAWWISLARTFHFYEAILAALAVVIWHFYQVFLDPDVAPMNRAWLDGTMPVEHYQREHELDLPLEPEAPAEPEVQSE